MSKVTAECNKENTTFILTTVPHGNCTGTEHAEEHSKDHVHKVNGTPDDACEHTEVTKCKVEGVTPIDPITNDT